MKKVLSLVLAFALVVGLFSMSFAAVPSDVAGTPYEKAVERLMAFGIVTGDDQGVRPNDSINRQEFIATLVRSLGMKNFADMSKGQTKFADVPAGSWASGVINVATGTITNGYPDGTFGYGNEVTYAEAITMIVRALGYRTPAMDANWPNSYLYKANEIDLIKNVENMTKNGAATRGNIFLMLDNALDQPMVSVNSNGGFDKIQSNGADVNMLSKLDTKTIEGIVSNYSSKKATVKVGTDTVKVEEDFDFQAVKGLKVRVWVDDDSKLISMKVVDNAIYSTAKYDHSEQQIEIDDVKYDISTASGTLVILDGAAMTSDKEVDYAKIVINKDDEVVYFEGHTLSGNVLVKDVNEDREILYGYNTTKKIAKFTLVKDGKEITVEDIEDGDLVLYNSSDKYAVVYNNVVEGEITKVYTSSFKVDGEEYVTAGKYIVGESTAPLDKDVLKQMKDEGDVKVYLNTKGDVYYVDGELGEAETTGFYALVTKQTVTWDNENGTNWSLDVIKQDGEAVTYKLPKDIVDNHTTLPSSGSPTWESTIKDGVYVKVTLDEDGEVSAVNANLTVANLPTNQATSSAYIGADKVAADVVVFERATNINKSTTTTWGELDFDIITGGRYVSADHDVVIVEVTAGNEDKNTVTERIFVTDAKKDEENNIYEVTYELNGSEEFATTEAVVGKNKFYEVNIDKENEEITTATELNFPGGFTGTDRKEVTLDSDATTVLETGVIKDNASATYDINDAVIYGSDNKQISLDELSITADVELYFDGASTYYVQYVRVK